VKEEKGKQDNTHRTATHLFWSFFIFPFHFFPPSWGFAVFSEKAHYFSTFFKMIHDDLQHKIDGYFQNAMRFCRG
jgi:hypothetical protein